jgi:hypothetical protein
MPQFAQKRRQNRRIRADAAIGEGGNSVVTRLMRIKVSIAGSDGRVLTKLRE